MLDILINQVNKLIYVPDINGGMVHPGLPASWVVFILFCMALIGVRSVFFATENSALSHPVHVITFPLLNRVIKYSVTRPWILVSMRLVAAALFLLVIYAGLFGTPIPEKNIATVLTWTIWWSGVVISVFFVGSAWCAICPWDAIASWLVKQRLWRRGDETSSLNLRVPRILRSVWPALLMFIGLTWLELGVGVTVNPHATALMALFMVVLATVSLALYERKAFCHYFCAVGRTIGVYSSVAPLALRPVDESICASCTTLECYHGTEEVEPCPTHLVMGRLNQNTYCTSCGACSMSCPEQNVSWKWRGVGNELTYISRPHWDEAWFILGLVALTIFHGLTMMPFWESAIKKLAYIIGDSGSLLTSFSLGMIVSMIIPVILFLLCIRATLFLIKHKTNFKRLFSTFALSLLPLAFTYHIAHNLTHLVRESHGFLDVLLNPTGKDALPLSKFDIYMCQTKPPVPNDIIFFLQGSLVIFGFWLALRIARQRFNQLSAKENVNSLALLPLLIFITAISFSNLWLLMQPMIMRM